MLNRRLAARALIINDDKLFVVKLKKKPGLEPSIGIEYWCTPGGGIDQGEAIIPALEREMIEETGIKPAIGNLIYIQQFENNNLESIEFFFHVTNGDDYLNIDLSQTSHGNIEIAEIDFFDPKTINLLPKFLTEVDLIKDIKKGETKFYSYI